MSRSSSPQVVVIAGPNGAGKSTLAPRLLKQTFGVYTFVNADIAAIQAGRMIHRWIDELRNARVDFAFETTLAGVGLRQQLRELGDAGYVIHLVYLWLPSASAAVGRVRGRVRIGGHSVPEEDVRRRYERGLRNFMEVYREMAADWLIYDASRSVTGGLPPVIAAGTGSTIGEIVDPAAWAKINGDAG